MSYISSHLHKGEITFYFEVEKGRHGAALVVAAQQVHTRRVVYLQCQQQRHNLDAEAAAVDIVAEEKVLPLWHISELIKNIQ